jgi:hypothetical protein
MSVAQGMLCAVTSNRAVVIAGLLSATVVLAACSSTTSGAGHGGSPTTTASSTADFPTASPTEPGDTTSPPPTSEPSDTSAASIHPAPATPLKTLTVDAADGTTYVVKIWADVSDPTCFDHAYGEPIITFLTKHPCSGLHRYLGTTSVKGRPVGFAESATGFHGTSKDPYIYASQFGQLEEQDGTGSLNDLLREGYRLPAGPTSVPASEAFNVLGQDEGVTVWDVWYLTGPTPNNDKDLIKLTTDLFLQF